MAIEIGFAHKKVEFRRVAANFNQPDERFRFEIGAFRASRRDANHIQVAEVVRFGIPKRLERRGGLGISFREEIAQAQKISRLRRSGRVAQDVYKRQPLARRAAKSGPSNIS